MTSARKSAQSIRITTPNLSGGPSGVEFGISVAVGGGIIAVGAPGQNDLGGSAYTFNQTTGALMSSMLNPQDIFKGDFGYAVAISEGIVAVGALGNDVNSIVESGVVHTYNATTGALLHMIDNPAKPQNSSTSGDYFGYSLTAGGNDLTVGSIKWCTKQTVRNIGRAYVYDLKKR